MGFALKNQTTSKSKAYMRIILKLILKEPEWESMDWLYLVQDRDNIQRSVLFWYITLRIVVIPSRRYRQSISHFFFFFYLLFKELQPVVHHLAFHGIFTVVGLKLESVT